MVEDRKISDFLLRDLFLLSSFSVLLCTWIFLVGSIQKASCHGFNELRRVDLIERWKPQTNYFAADKSGNMVIILVSRFKVCFHFFKLKWETKMTFRCCCFDTTSTQHILCRYKETKSVVVSVLVYFWSEGKVWWNNSRQLLCDSSKFDCDATCSQFVRPALNTRLDSLWWCLDGVTFSYSLTLFQSFTKVLKCIF